ncbi:MAG: hypothetical protein U9Q82_11185, partial [Chloroflexota bacterium]|nr:hypothetical protein [Chloroflexota bacterium]
GDGLGVLENLPRVIGPVATSIDDAKRALSWVAGEMRQRFERNDNTRPEDRIIVVIDEIQEFTKDDTITELIRLLSSQGRGARIHLMIGTQHPKSSAFGGDSTIRRNLPGRLALRTEDYKASEVVVGGSTPRADHLLGAGDAYAITPKATHRAQMAYIPQRELVRDWCDARPVMDSWPKFDPTAVGTLPVDNQDDVVKWEYSGKELALAIIQAAQGNGRPTLKDALENAGMTRPGSGRADRLLNLARAAFETLIDQNWTMVQVNPN